LSLEGNAFREVYFGSQVIRFQAQFLAERGDGFIEITVAHEDTAEMAMGLGMGRPPAHFFPEQRDCAFQIVVGPERR
jgi:hypothetical protein